MKLTVIAVLLAGLMSYAQEPPPAPAPSAQEIPAQAAAPEAPTVTVTPGTQILLSLVRPVSTRTTKVGDKVYLQTSAPVVVGDKLAIPAGTYLEGILNKAPRAQWTKRRASLQLRQASLVFGNGYTVAIPGTLDVTVNLRESTSTYGDYGTAAVVPIGAAAGGSAIGGLANGVRGAAIGGMVGGVAGTVIAVAMILHRGGVFMDVGTPVEATLDRPVSLEQDRVLDAARRFGSAQVLRPAPRHMCYVPGSPGTPDTVIPGTPATPGTPDTVIPGPPGSPPTVIPGTPGTPGTPDTVIPGTPATPGQSYPCPPE